ncbi:MAG TPA: FAD:protein FMN transferase [Candidatus Gallibacteroides avistercoris]|uniref:FAD:protein FMN transferase n=1 Tax=Candidatus Gallibacteroides avistercoris TaxID=2840833 RepID=A0A9D1SC76_9BACT|nr:FAD:protein FMN transferase [Candidatus Gallibacteroides avistercoris]
MNKTKGFIAALLFLFVFLAFYFFREKSPQPYQTNSGMIFGTLYNIKYQYKKDIQADIEAELKRFELSLSPFNSNSVIARINNNDPDIRADEWFTTVFNKSKEIYQLSDGYFDPTVSPLINAWGFGFEKSDSVTQELIDSLLVFVGMDKISLSPEGKAIKTDPRIKLDFSAIAKGYGCDVVGRYLEKRGIRNFMVEIGGEVVARGVNPSGNCWRLGIRVPKEGDAAGPIPWIEKIALCDAALATSGNYLNYRIKDGKKFAHTINPKDGKPIQRSLLSATVLSKDCMTADALATTFMVVGLEQAMELAESLPDVEAYFISASETDTTGYHITQTSGMSRHIVP